MDYFWTPQPFIPAGVGYGEFSATHFILLSLTALLTLVVTAVYRRADQKGRLRIRRAIAVSLFVMEIIKLIVYYITGVDVSRYLPLEICSFAAYSIMFEAIFPDKDIFSQMLLLVFLPGAAMALLVPTTAVLPGFSFFTIHQFVFHGLIIAYAFARFFCGETEITYRGLWASVPKILVIVGAVYLIDLVFDRNFMFLRDTTGNPLLDLIYNTATPRFYVLGLIVFAILVLHIFFFLFISLERLAWRR